MKRRREMEKGSEIRSGIEELSMVVFSKAKPTAAVGDHHHTNNTTSTAAATHLISIKPFLFVCNLLLQVLDKIGPTMAVLRQDIHQNIQRLEKFYESDPSRYSDVVEIIKKEASEGRARKRTSCSSAFVWLTRSLDFTVKMLQLIIEDFGLNMEEAVEESYKTTLKPWHGWISSIAFRVAIKLVPDNKTLINILMAKDEEHEQLKEEIQTFTSLLVPLLQDIHSTLKTFGLNELKTI
ncbi:hypothetical protein LguiA_018314 [Lonicera macranthoides]